MMPMFEGTAGTPLEIETESHLLSCRWSFSQACAGGAATLLVLTDYVGRDCPMSFSVFGEDGKRIDELRGKVVNNICAVDWIVPKTAKGRLFFLAESKAVGISGRSDLLQVLEHARFGPVEALDPGGKKISEVNVGETVRWRAKMPGIPDGTDFRWTILCHQDPAHVHVAAKGVGQAAQGLGVVDWRSELPFPQGDKKSQSDLDPTSETYQDATFQAVFEGLGVTGKSPHVAARTWVLIHMEGTRRRHSVKSPDGTKRTLDASQDPDLRMESLGVGSGWIGPADQAD
jgi:hypothetical protein